MIRFWQKIYIEMINKINDEDRIVFVYKSRSFFWSIHPFTSSVFKTRNIVGVLVDGWWLEKKQNILNFLNLIAKHIKTEVNINIFQTIKKTETSSSAVETNWKLNSTTRKL